MLAAQPDTVCASGDCDFATLAEALDAEATDIWLEPGDHAGGGVVARAGTVITGDPGARIVEAPANKSQLRIAASNVELVGLTFSSAGPTVVDGKPAILVVGSYFGIVLTDVSIVGGASTEGAGGLGVYGATVEVNGSTFAGNIGAKGAAIRIMGGAHVTVNDSTFVANQTTPNWLFEGNGGAISVIGSTLTVADSTFSGNAAGGYGGHIFASESTLDLTGLIMEYGDSFGGGALALHRDSRATLTDSTLHANAGAFGSAVDLFGADSMLMDGVVVTGHSESAAVSLTSGMGLTEIRRSTFDGNPGGAISSWFNADTLISDSWFCGDGGSTFGQNAPVSLAGCAGRCAVEHSTFVDNDSAWTFGAISVASAGGPVRITSSTFLHNAGTTTGAIDLRNAPDVVLQGLIVAETGGAMAIRSDQDSSGATIENLVVSGNVGDLDPKLLGSPIQRAAVFTDQGNRCGQTPAVLACVPENDFFFDNTIGAGTQDVDADDVVATCDCDDDDPDRALDGECDPETRPYWPSDRPIERPASAPDTVDRPDPLPALPDTPLTTFLVGGGGCGCAADSSPLSAGWTAGLKAMWVRRPRSRR